MNKLLLALTSIIINADLFGQSEFKTYENGLIYNMATMNKLERIVDSLNLKYKTCDMSKVFNSKYQTVGHIVRIDTGNVRQAKKDMDKGMSLENFVAKYPQSEVERDILIVKFSYKDYKGEEIAEFCEVALNSSSYGFEIYKNNQNDLYHKPVKATWIYQYHEKSNYSNESIHAFFFPEEFQTIPLATEYCRQIGYSDCLIDTSSAKFKDDAEPGWIELPENWQALSKNEKETLLEEMRATKIVGRCSQDGRPREHAINIALLSAETTNWEIFLKSHLDIMNDRFERISDAGYAMTGRETYLRELEELNINVPDLLFGITMRIEGPAQNHYYGNIGRLGRAISESKDIEEFKKRILAAIEDAQLDDYNRILFYFLFLNYNHFVKSKEVQQENLKQLKNAVAKLPGYLKEKIQLAEE